MNKKAITILGAIFVLIIGTLGFLVYLKYSAKKSTPVVSNPVATSTPVSEDPASTTVGSIPNQAPSTNLVSLTTDQVLSPTLFYNGSGITYFDHQGSLFQSALQDNNGKQELVNKKNLSIKPKLGITKILWPPTGNDFIAQIDTNGTSTWSYFNSQIGDYTDLPPQIYSLDWMPTGNKIMYIWVQNGKATLNISDPDGKNWKKITDMWELDDAISVSPDGASVLYYRTTSTDINNPIILMSADGKVFQTKVQDGYNLGVLWSPDSKKFLFSKRDPNSQKYQIWEDNIMTGEIKNLGLFTSVAKAVWDKDSQTVFAAVPNTGTSSENSLSVDTVYKVNTSDLTKQEFDISPTVVDAEDLFLSTASDKLFFRNAQDGGLYYLNVVQ